MFIFLEWPSLSPDLNPIENLWQDLTTAVHRHSPSNQTKLELFCKEEWANIQSLCALLVETYPKRLAAFIATNGGSTKYWLFFFFIFKKVLKPCIIFLPLHNYAPRCVGLSHKVPLKYICVCGCNQGGNFTAATAGLPHTLAFMPREKIIIVRPQWPLFPWPSQRTGLALNYSNLSAQ